MSSRVASSSTATTAVAACDFPPIEVASLFYTGLNEPRPTSMDFSFDGLHFISSHNDDAVRLIDVGAMTHTDTILCETFGVHDVSYTHSSAVACVAPRFYLDGHLHLLNTETAQFFGEMAYLNDTEPELPVVANTPVYSTLVQCPVSDIIAAVIPSRRRVALFHPLIAGAVAATPEHSITGAKTCITFSHDGTKVAIGDDHLITVLDRRLLDRGPVVSMPNASVFSVSPALARCKGLEFNTDAKHLLCTSSFGEVLQVDWAAEQPVQSYYDGDAKRHFVGSSDAIGARYIHPYRERSPVVQATSSMVGGRHLLLYDGLQQRSAQSLGRGHLVYELQSKDSDVPVALAVNRRFNLVASAARNVTWWAWRSACGKDGHSG